MPSIMVLWSTMRGAMANVGVCIRTLTGAGGQVLKSMAGRGLAVDGHFADSSLKKSFVERRPELRRPPEPGLLDLSQFGGRRAYGAWCVPRL